MASQNDRRTGRRVGELAAATGLTVRTLHYYEEIGLLVASDRSDAGHRLYADADVERLYRDLPAPPPRPAARRDRPSPR